MSKSEGTVDLDAIVRAQGLALATLEALLIHKGVLQLGELASGLANMETSTTQVDAECGDVLAEWVSVLRQVDAAPIGTSH